MELFHFTSSSKKKLRAKRLIPNFICPVYIEICVIPVLLHAFYISWQYTYIHVLCTGHVIRMPDARLPKKVFYGELQEGKRSQGGQKKRYKDTLKASLKDFEIPMGSWEQTAQERSKWRGLINKGAALYE